MTVRIPYAASADQPGSVSPSTQSARTTAPRRVRPPPAVGIPPRSRTLKHPCQSSVELCTYGNQSRRSGRVSLYCSGSPHSSFWSQNSSRAVKAVSEKSENNPSTPIS